MAGRVQGAQAGLEPRRRLHQGGEEPDSGQAAGDGQDEEERPALDHGAAAGAGLIPIISRLQPISR